MQLWQYGKGLIYLRPIFRLTKLAFLRARATLKKNTTTATDINKSALCRLASLSFSFVTDPEGKNQLVLFRRVEWASALKGIFVVVFVPGLGEIKGSQDHAGLVTAYLVSDYITSSSNCTRFLSSLNL